MRANAGFILQALLAALFFGASAPLSKLLLVEVPPVLLAAFLYLGSGIGISLVKLSQRLTLNQREAGIRRPDVKWLAGAIVSGGILAPIVDIELRGPGGRVVRDAALIDSGADASAFPVHWMRRLGIRKGDCRRSRFETAGGQGIQWTYNKDIVATIVGHELPLKAVFVDAPVALLGRQDFFAHFAVAFDQRNERLTLRRYPD